MDDSLKRRAELYVEIVWRFDRAMLCMDRLKTLGIVKKKPDCGPRLARVLCNAERDQLGQVARWVRARLRERPPLELPPEPAPDDDGKQPDPDYELILISTLQDDVDAMLGAWSEIYRITREQILAPNRGLHP